VKTSVAKFFGFSSAVISGRARSTITALLETLRGENEVPFIVPSNACPSIVAEGATPNAKIMAVDIEKETGLPSDESFVLAIQRVDRPGVVMPTHLCGFYRDYNDSFD
jgi:dTDP-4-amino-4,6-dideoxygalactose transaminase